MNTMVLAMLLAMLLTPPLLGLAGVVSALAYIRRPSVRTQRLGLRLVPLTLWLTPIAFLALLYAVPGDWVYVPSGSPDHRPFFHSFEQKVLLGVVAIAPAVAGFTLRRAIEESRRRIHTVGPAVLGVALMAWELFASSFRGWM